MDPGQSGFTPGQNIPFGQKFVNGIAPGNWQWLDINGTGASNLQTNIVNGATTSFTIGDNLQSATGIKAGPVNSGLSTRFQQCQSVESAATPSFHEPCSTAAANPTDIPASDPCLVVVPAVDYHGCTGNCVNLTIEGFALIYLDSTSDVHNINGCFVKGIKSATISSSTAPDLGGGAIDALLQ